MKKYPLWLYVYSGAYLSVEIRIAQRVVFWYNELI